MPEDRSEALLESSESADETMSESGVDAQARECPSTTWISIQLIGEDDEPIPNEMFSIEFADGGLYEGTLDSEGIASIEGVPAGTCYLTFPQIDGERVEQIEN